MNLYTPMLIFTRYSKIEVGSNKPFFWEPTFDDLLARCARECEPVPVELKNHTFYAYEGVACYVGYIYRDEVD